MHTENMKRKVAKVAPLRLSPNEEALILKQERERRRKLRLQQVREQEKFIAQQIRQDVKERRDQQLQRLGEELKAKWETQQAEKLQALEKVYLSTLNSIGEAHRQAKENEPDLKAMERTAALNNEKAQKRHREALKELQQHREKLLREQTWHIQARKKALHIEKERAEKIASLPPPPPDPIQNLEVVKRPQMVKLCNVDGFSMSYYHLPEAYVDREMDVEQPDARVSAVEEGKRLEALQKEEERERREQLEKAILRGSYALKTVQLTQDRERLMKELEHMQQEDLSRRRQIVSKMPQQLFEPPYRRAEIQEEWQREMECAFEDMYSKDSKIKGDMVLLLKPQPLPDPSVASIDEDLDLSVEPQAVSDADPLPTSREESSPADGPQESAEPQSKLMLRRLLSRIRTQQDQWSAKSDAESAIDTLESGSLPLEDVAHDSPQEERQANSLESKEVTDNTVLAGNSVLLHPQEQAAHVRLETERKIKMEDLERQKMEQLELLKRLEEERVALEEEYSRVLQLQEANREMAQEPTEAVQEDRPEPVAHEIEPEDPSVPTSEENVSAENLHIQMIREYQQRLIEQNRLHKQSVDEARRRLLEYQLLLKKRHPHLSTPNLKTPEKNLERSTDGQIGGPEMLQGGKIYDGTAITARDPYTTPTTATRYSEQQPEAHITRTSEAFKPKATSLRSSMKEPDFRDDVVSNTLGQSLKLSHAASASKNGSLIDEPPQELFSLSDSPQEDKSRLPHIGDKQSSTSSPGDYETSSSTSYNPLPSELSLGLPRVDLSEPSIPSPLPLLGAKDYPSLGDFSNIREFRERLLSSTVEIRAQQDQLKAMQDHLDQQRDSLLSKQKNQEKQLLQRQRQLEEQMRRHREALENVLCPTEPEENQSQSDFSLMPRKEPYHFMSTLLEELEDSSQDDLSQETSNDFSSVLIRPPTREHRWRPSKPPVTKTKLGPYLEQHELSAIIEVETPTSGRRSSTGLDSSTRLPGRTNESVLGFPETIKADSMQTEVSKLSNRSVDQSGNRDRNQSRAKLSWKEMLSAEASCDSMTTGQLLQADADQQELDLSGSSTRSTNRNHPKFSWRDMLSLDSSGNSSLTGQSSQIQTNFNRRELDVSEMSTTSMEQAHLKFSWRDMLCLDASRHANLTGLLRTPMAAGSPITNGMPLVFPPGSEGMARHGGSTNGGSPQDIGENLSTTISTGSFLTSEKTDASPANSDAMSELHRCNYSIIGESQDGSPAAAKVVMRPETRWSALPGAPESSSHIQQIIEKYTRDLSASLDSSFFPPAAVPDTSAACNPFPTTFYSLDPKPDLSASTSSFINQNSSTPHSINLSQVSKNTTGQEQPGSLSFLHGGAHVMPSPASMMAQRVDQARMSTGILPGSEALASPLHNSAAENSFPTSFYALDPKPDFSVSTPSYAFSDQTGNSSCRDMSQDSQSTNSQDQQSHQSPWSPSHSNMDQRFPPAAATVQNIDPAKMYSRTDEPADCSESFLPLHPESTLNDTHVSGQHEASHGVLAQRLECVDSGVQPDGSQFSQVSCSIHTGLRYTPTTLSAPSVAEESGSFHELMATKTTVNDSDLSEHPISYHKEKNHSRSVHFEELPVVNKDCPSQEDKAPETSISPRLDSCSITATEMDASNQTLAPGRLTLGSHSGSSLTISSITAGSYTGSLPSCVYSWGSGSSRGIMEEPDLTLLSLNDSSIVCSEPVVTRSSVTDTQEDTNSSQSSFKPLPAEVDASAVEQPDRSSFGGTLSQNFAELGSEFTSTPGSLQEAFLLKKKQFIEKSSQRLQDLETRDKLPTMNLLPEARGKQEGGQQPASDPAQADGGQLKRVVEVRVSTPEDRKLSEMEMHQRTVRLYNRLDEVKTRKEEKMRQEAYAKNREKAKEFKKRTLEKLRANKRK